MSPFSKKEQTSAFFQSAGSCPVWKVFSNKKHITGAISIVNCFKTTGLMEIGSAALSGFRFDNSFRTSLRSILISGIVEHRGLYFHEYFLERSCVSSWYTIALT